VAEKFVTNRIKTPAFLYSGAFSDCLRDTTCDPILLRGNLAEEQKKKFSGGSRSQLEIFN
jgi:hypothetical protein